MKNFKFWSAFPDWFYKLLGFLAINFVLYVFGCIIAWDHNPTHWWLLRTVFGRTILLVLELIVIFSIIEDRD